MKRIYNIKFLIAGVGLLSLQSCFVAKEYDQPEVVEEEYYRTDNIKQDSLNMANISWTEMFTDPILQDYINKGLENNIDIRVAMQQIIAAEAYVKQGKAGYLPTISGNGTYTHQELSQNGQFGSFFSSVNQYQINADLSWEADIWGKIRSQKRAFDARYLQSIAAHQAVKTRLIANIASTYYQLLSLDEQIRITKETIDTRENSLETTRALKEAGNLTEVGVKQTEAQLYTAQGILIDLQNEERLLENTLSILLGEAPMQIERSELDEQEITTELNIGVPVQLLRNRPDVIAAEYDLVNAFELTNVAKSNFYPSLTLTASGGLQALEAGDLFDANSLFATIIGGIAQPILNGRRIRTEYEVSQAQQEQARLEFRRAILTASKEVSDALYTYQAATNKIEVKQKEYEAYGLATDYSEELLNNGLANYLEVLTARENALNSSLDLSNAKYNQLKAVVDLYEALGGGWQ
ncbi:NodT family efflux transporter outer membrane factor (OMF) lipoprotein [Christiangramia gaetbulicola]|uniref:NodT family efflux transporter outer membrane factor (OMF) lipoprotein n=1 Tax=Christiangramia gaetbulicola TaxID=703340 RepID=A0A2T6AM85_9FLAO|nr:TolC family protein [Christiangramia gaetbulicola]PTX44938.1 NodT family efflux transporter outer membrane factor (OMF) lipoprotein [Christiangramia gaetbulicola]